MVSAQHSWDSRWLDFISSSDVSLLPTTPPSKVRVKQSTAVEEVV